MVDMLVDMLIASQSREAFVGLGTLTNSVYNSCPLFSCYIHSSALTYTRIYTISNPLYKTKLHLLKETLCVQ